MLDEVILLSNMKSGIARRQIDTDWSENEIKKRMEFEIEYYCDKKFLYFEPYCKEISYYCIVMDKFIDKILLIGLVTKDNKEIVLWDRYAQLKEWV